ncbi:phosphotyrosine protein phosphatase [Schizopora paradoxa]|uniref:Phosphotyrosine protein phosphatase n=1 Tax=Schizopora paradoxa TaxID=27342 RepID=A0A0H2RZJ9_9AGAM|nr:phosphotyrosine protein phosphatase [Schizopora paradoxa]
MSTSVLIVCLGNICRSPMGEAVLRHVGKERGVDLKVDSAGTAAYHTGEDPDDRTVDVCKQNGVAISHAARQVTKQDYYDFDYILGADTQNLENLKRRKPDDSKAKVALFGSFIDGEPEAISDPYYGGTKGFKTCFKQCERFSHAFLDHLERKASS